jgi:hypothetical protein
MSAMSAMYASLRAGSVRQRTDRLECGASNPSLHAWRNDWRLHAVAFFHPFDTVSGHILVYPAGLM